MAKTSIYLPDDLAEQVRARGIPVSEVAQAALRQAVKEAELKENVMTDIQAVAERLRETQRQAREKSASGNPRIREKGREWARTLATADELEYVVTFSGDVDHYAVPPSLGALPVFNDDWWGVPTGPGQHGWEHFQAGAREVWEAVQPLLFEHDEHGATTSPGSGGYSGRVNPQYTLWLGREPGPDAPPAEHDRWLADQPAEFL